MDPATLDDEQLLAYLPEMPLVTVGEAYRMVLMLRDPADVPGDFEARRRKLEALGIARPAWKLQEEDVIDRGSVAYMVCRVCDIRGGVNAHLFGSWGLGDRRYAYRELVYRQLMDEASEYEYMTGAAMNALISKADEYLEKKGAYQTERVELSDEASRDEEGRLIVPPPIPPQPPP